MNSNNKNNNSIRNKINVHIWEAWNRHPFICAIHNVAVRQNETGSTWFLLHRFSIPRVPICTPIKSNDTTVVLFCFAFLCSKIFHPLFYALRVCARVPFSLFLEMFYILSTLDVNKKRIKFPLLQIANKLNCQKMVAKIFCRKSLAWD